MGPNHYMEWVNLHFAIYSEDRTQDRAPDPRQHALHGHALLRQHNNGDPIVLYDQYAGRWIASQFAFNGTSDRAVLPVHRGLEHERSDR